MILLDENAEPQNTVYYISVKTFEIIKKEGLLDYSALYKNLNKHIPTSQTIYSLGLDFLFLLNKININEQGKLYVIKETDTIQ